MLPRKFEDSLVMLARILLFAALFSLGLWGFSPVEAQSKNEAQLLYLFANTEWKLETACGGAYVAEWTGVANFSNQGQFSADTECRHHLEPRHPVIRGNWLIKNGLLCFDNVVSSDSGRLKGFKTGYCFEVLVEKTRFKLKAVTGDRDWSIRPIRHPEHNTFDELLQGLKQRR